MPFSGSMNEPLDGRQQICSHCGLGSSHMQLKPKACDPQLLSLCSKAAGATATEPKGPRALALHQEKRTAVRSPTVNWRVLKLPLHLEKSTQQQSLCQHRRRSKIKSKPGKASEHAVAFLKVSRYRVGKVDKVPKSGFKDT